MLEYYPNLSFLLALVTMALAVADELRLAKILKPFSELCSMALTISLSAFIVHRGVSSGRVPLSNLYESLIFLSWSICVTALILRFAFKMPLSILIGGGLACIVLGLSGSFESTAYTLLPALRSNWLIVHVSTTMIAYGAFALAFGAATCRIFIHRENEEKRRQFELSAVRASYIGFVFLTVGICTGSIWAKQAWGSYWGWDPKETWSLITWLIYASFIHLRFIRQWKGALASWFLIIGFACVIFTYFGVTYLMSGLHSYG